jgi:hypothetical protein
MSEKRDMQGFYEWWKDKGPTGYCDSTDWFEYVQAAWEESARISRKAALEEAREIVRQTAAVANQLNYIAACTVIADAIGERIND